MTISNSETRDEYEVGPGGQDVFIYSFRIFSEDDLNVYANPPGVICDDDANIITDYTVQGVGDAGGGTITTGSLIPEDYVVVIQANMPFNRTEDFQNNGDQFAEDFNEDQDRSFNAAKINRDRILSRTLQFQECEPRGGKSNDIPTPQENYVLGWDANGNLINFQINTSSGTIIVTVTTAEFAEIAADLGMAMKWSELDSNVDPVPAETIVFGDSPPARPYQLTGDPSVDPDSESYALNGAGANYNDLAARWAYDSFLALSRRNNILVNNSGTANGGADGVTYDTLDNALDRMPAGARAIITTELPVNNISSARFLSGVNLEIRGDDGTEIIDFVHNTDHVWKIIATSHITIKNLAVTAGASSSATPSEQCAFFIDGNSVLQIAQNPGDAPVTVSATDGSANNIIIMNSGSKIITTNTTFDGTNAAAATDVVGVGANPQYLASFDAGSGVSGNFNALPANGWKD